MRKIVLWCGIISLVFIMGACSGRPEVSYTLTGPSWSFPTYITIYADIKYTIIANSGSKPMDTYIIAFDVYDTEGHVYRCTDMLLAIPHANDSGNGTPASETANVEWYNKYTIRAVEPVHIEIWPAWNQGINEYVIPFVRQDDGTWLATTM